MYSVSENIRDDILTRLT